MSERGDAPMPCQAAPDLGAYLDSGCQHMAASCSTSYSGKFSSERLSCAQVRSVVTDVATP